MTYALLVVQLLETEDGELSNSASAFLAKTRGTADPTESASRLGLGCWQLDLRTNLPQLSTLIRKATDCGCSYKVVFFEQEPDWCPSKHS